MDAKHTPPPYFVVSHPNGWSIQTRPTGAGVCIAQKYADSSVDEANFIVRACNAHDSLVNALTLLTEKVEANGGGLVGYRDEVTHARAALALARGEA